MEVGTGETVKTVLDPFKLAQRPRRRRGTVKAPTPVSRTLFPPGVDWILGHSHI
jgi:hypothetical protein